MKAKFNLQAQKVKILQAKFPKLASCPGKWGYITFATYISKHKYIKEYLDQIETKSISLSDKFKLNGVPIEFSIAEDTRDTNLRYIDSTSRTGRIILMFLIGFAPIISLTIILLALSYALTIDQPTYCLTSTCTDSVTTGSDSYYALFPLIVALIISINCAIRWFVAAYSFLLRDFSRVIFVDLVS